MFLFIFESIGTSELLLVGVIALIFLGPRRMPDLARKLGKMMAEFRGTASEFKETWQREVDFENEIKAFDPDSIEAESGSVPRISSISPESESLQEPTIKEVDAETLERLRSSAEVGTAENNGAVMESEVQEDPPATPQPPEPVNDKRNWL